MKHEKVIPEKNAQNVLTLRIVKKKRLTLVILATFLPRFLTTFLATLLATLLTTFLATFLARFFASEMAEITSPTQNGLMIR